MCALASRDVSLPFRFGISFFLTQTQSAPAFQESRAHFPARNVKSVPRSRRKKCGLLEFFSPFFFLETFGGGGGGALDVAHVLRCVCAGAEGMPRKDSQALRRIKLPIDTSSGSHYRPPPGRPALPPPPPPSPPPTQPPPPCKNPLGCSSHLPRRIFSLP